MEKSKRAEIYNYPSFWNKKIKNIRLKSPNIVLKRLKLKQTFRN